MERLWIGVEAREIGFWSEKPQWVCNGQFCDGACGTFLGYIERKLFPRLRPDITLPEIGQCIEVPADPRDELIRKLVKALDKQRIITAQCGCHDCVDAAKAMQKVLAAAAKLGYVPKEAKS